MASRQRLFLVAFTLSAVLGQQTFAQSDTRSLATPTTQATELYPGNTLGPEGFNQAEVNALATSNPMLWQQYQTLQTGGYAASCPTCGPSSKDRCGCRAEIFPWIEGQGDYDTWCVGPKWGIEASGLLWFREEADLATIAGIGGADLVDNFDSSPGGRLFATAYNQERGFGIQIGYEGVNDWISNVVFPVGGAGVGAGGGALTQSIQYESRLNSVEINFLPDVPYNWKLFSGLRYIQLDEDFLDSTVETRTAPAPATPPGVSPSFTDTFSNNLLENRLFGFQVGARRDAWQLGNFITVQAYGNAGVYSNRFRRNDNTATITTFLTGDDTMTPGMVEFSENSTVTSQTSTRSDFNEVAFAGEAGISAGMRITPNTTLLLGYQGIILDGVGLGLAASTSPGLNSDTLIVHGLQFGCEYRR